MPEDIPGEVLVMGAGTIGCFIGGSLAAAGVPVTFVGRPRVLEKLAVHGLTVTDMDGATHRLPADSLRLCEQVPNGNQPALVLLCVKSGATAEAAGELAFAAGRHHRRLAAERHLQLRGGLADGSVAQCPGRHGAVQRRRDRPRGLPPRHPGRLAAEDDAALRSWQAVFARAGVPLDLHADLLPVQWGKLMLNLNNPVNALSGLPLRGLMLRGYRRCFASLIDEALGVLNVAGIAPAQVAAVPARRLPGLLRLPDWLFRIVAARMLRIDAKARSSMADDLALGRRTEIDALSGEVVRLAQTHGLSAPRNARMVALLEAWPQQPKRWTARQLQDALGL